MINRKVPVRDHKRDEAIYELREYSRWKFPRIGKKYNITSVRVRQIYLRMIKERGIISRIFK